MAELESALKTIRVLSPAGDHDWCLAETLVAELVEWDLQQSQALGFQRDEVISLFYSGSTGAIRHESVLPGGRALLALEGSLPVGCAAFRRVSSDVCELYNVYVRPSCRGRKVGAMLMQRLMAEAKAAGYRTMWLETAVFMNDAHKRYRSLGFHVRAPYRHLPAKFADATLWMECNLFATAQSGNQMETSTDSVSSVSV